PARAGRRRAGGGDGRGQRPRRRAARAAAGRRRGRGPPAQGAGGDRRGHPGLRRARRAAADQPGGGTGARGGARGGLRLINRAGERLLGGGTLLGQTAADLGIGPLLEGEAPRTLQLDSRGTWLLRRAEARLGGRAHSLVVLTDVG